MILAADGEVAAVLDWELCTLGDPLADVGLLMVYWSEPGDEFVPAVRSPPRWRPASRAARSCAAATRSAPGATSRELDFYVALGYWKLAFILEGVYARYAAGQYGKTTRASSSSREIVERLAERADEAERRLD